MDLVRPVALAVLLVAAPLRAAAAQIPERFTNLQVLPQSISRDSLLGVMRNFSFALGVRCQYCHIGGDGISFEGVRFADDDDEDKQKARYMMRLVERLNGELLEGLPQRDDPPVAVLCVTCHRGTPRPRTIEAVVLESVATAGADSAVALYRQLRTTYFGSGAYDFTAQRLVEVARALARQRSHADAERILLLNAEFSPGHVGTHVLLADVRLQQADTAGAISALQRALELDPQSADARRRLEQIRRRDPHRPEPGSRTQPERRPRQPSDTGGPSIP